MSEENGKLATVAELLTSLKGKRRYKTVTLPNSGLMVRIQSLMAGEQNRYETVLLSADGKLDKRRMEDAESRLIVKCIVDDAGNRLFSDAQAPEVAAWDGADAAFLYRECAAHCGINRNQEMVEKNLPEIQPAS